MTELIKRLLERFHALRYAVAGGLAFAGEYSSFFVLLHLMHLPLIASNSLSFGVGLLVSFLLNRAWAFKQPDFAHSRHRQMLLYIVLALVNLVLTNCMVSLLEHISVDPLIGKILSMATVVVWNFFIFKKLIFKAPKA